MNNRILYKATGASGCDFSIETAIGCKFNCTYCSSKLIAKRNGWINNWRKPIYKDISELEKKLSELSKHKNCLVFVSPTTDPFMDKITSDKSIKIIKEINNLGHRCRILTKGILPLELVNLSNKNEVGATVTKLKNSKKLEPFSPSSEKRLLQLEKIANKGIYTFISMQPVLDNNFDEVLQIAKRAVFVSEIFFGGLGYFGIPQKDKIKKRLEVSDFLFEFCGNNDIVLFNDIYVRKEINLRDENWIIPIKKLKVKKT